MSFQTKAINAISFTVALTTAFCGSKYTERLIMLKNNEDFICKLNSLSSEAKLRWKNDHEKLINQADQLKKLISFMEETENERIAGMLEEERTCLHQTYEAAIAQKSKQLEIEMKTFQSNLNERIEFSESLLVNIQSQLKDKIIEKNEIKKLEKISQMVIEDNIDGQFNNCYSVNSLRNEFIELLPIVRQYHLLNYDKISLFKFFISFTLTNSMFQNSKMQNFDILAELNANVEKGDLRRALCLFNNLNGWPRLLLKDWAEKCRRRLEFIHEIKYQLYMNKI